MSNDSAADEMKLPGQLAMLSKTRVAGLAWSDLCCYLLLSFFFIRQRYDTDT